MGFPFRSTQVPLPPTAPDGPITVSELVAAVPFSMPANAWSHTPLCTELQFEARTIPDGPHRSDVMPLGPQACEPPAPPPPPLPVITSSPQLPASTPVRQSPAR